MAYSTIAFSHTVPLVLGCHVVMFMELKEILGQKNYISLSFFLSYGKATDTLYQQVGLRNSAYCRTCIGHVSRDLHFEYCNCSSIDLRLRN